MGQQSFLPINFDREYTCLTMCTIHSTLIDYRFRQLMFPKRAKAQQQKILTMDAEGINIPKIDEMIQEEEQTFVMNGILVESKYDSPEEKQKQRQRLIKQFLQKQSTMIANNMTEYLFFNDYGQLTINEETVKAYAQDFSSIMKVVYLELKEKYEKTIGNILQNEDLVGIDFPMVASKS